MNAVKRILNIVLILIGVILIVVCTDLITNRTLKTDYSSLSDVDKTALDQIVSVVDLFDENNGNEDIWSKNYNPTDNGCIITRKLGFLKGTSYVINEDLSDNIFAQKIDMGEKYEDISVYRLAGCTPQTLTMYFSSEDNEVVNMGDKQLFSMEYSSSVAYSTGISLEENFVKTSFKDDIQTSDFPKYDVDIDFNFNSRNIALTGLQYRIIDDLLDEVNPEEIKELIAEYVTVREYQLSGAPKLALQQEKIELAQGCPQYALYCISGETGSNTTYFNRDTSNSIDFYSAFYYICTGQYSSDLQEYFNEAGNVQVGAALCEILDKKAVIPNWREMLDGSTEDNLVTQYSLIKAYCNSNCQEYMGKSISEIQRAYSFEEISSMSDLLVKNENSVTDKK